MVLHVPHFDGLEPRSAQTPEQQAGIEPVQGAAVQEPQNFGSLATLVQVPLQHVGWVTEHYFEVIQSALTENYI